ncbi:MAG TPA: PHP domain-containing protein [Galbitalea sp.]|nr:PHP domain-containing protein [Galbitalea sp.]
MDPVDALNEIAYLLERERASEFKTKAFRTAASVLASISVDQRAAQVESGELKKTKGIGSTSYEVIVEALDGRVPQYLLDARERAAVPLTSGGESILTLLKGDLHSHSDWSDGTTSIELMASTAQLLGREYLALTDHSPHLRVANGLTADRLRKELDVVASINKAADGFRLLSGIEVDILDDGALDQTDAMLGKLDIVVASVHSKLKMESSEMTERMLAAVSNPHTNLLGHCTGRLVEGSRGTRSPSSFDARAVFAACAANDVAVEINSRPERRDPPGPLIELALKAGCLFSIDSDAHAPGQLGLLDFGAARAEAHGVPADRIVTTWPLDRLLEWARG